MSEQENEKDGEESVTANGDFLTRTSLSFSDVTRWSY